MALDHLLFALRQEEAIKYLRDRHKLDALACECGCVDCRAMMVKCQSARARALRNDPRLVAVDCEMSFGTTPSPITGAYEVIPVRERRQVFSANALFVFGLKEHWQ